MRYKKVACSARWCAFANLTLSPICLRHTRCWHCGQLILFCRIRWSGCCEVDCFGKVRAPAVGVMWPIPVSYSSNRPTYALNVVWLIHLKWLGRDYFEVVFEAGYGVTWTRRNSSLLTFWHFMAFVVVVGWMRRSLVCMQYFLSPWFVMCRLHTQVWDVHIQ